MQKGTIKKVGELSPEERRAAEVLLGQALDEDDMVSVRTSKGRLIQQAPAGKVREEAFDRLFDRIARTAKRVEGIAEEEIDAAIDEAVDLVRHGRG
jgi:hypothetical protein